jgi:hypothetical protein
MSIGLGDITASGLGHDSVSPRAADTAEAIQIISVDIDSLPSVWHTRRMDNGWQDPGVRPSAPLFWQVSFWSTRRASSFDQRCHRF